MRHLSTPDQPSARRPMRVTSWMWLGPVAFLVHDGEELATIGPWLAAHRAELPGIARVLASVTVEGFAASVLVLLCGLVLATLHGVHRARRGRRSLPWLAVAGAFVANGITHAAQAAWFGGYVPGVVTAVLVSVPWGIATARAYRRAELASPRMLIAAGSLGLLLQVPLALAALAAGKATR